MMIKAIKVLTIKVLTIKVLTIKVLTIKESIHPITLITLIKQEIK